MLHDQLMIGLSILTVLSSGAGTVTLRIGLTDRIKASTAASDIATHWSLQKVFLFLMCVFVCVCATKKSGKGGLNV